MKNKNTISAIIVSIFCASLKAQDASVVVSSSTVSRIVSREPRSVLFNFSIQTGEVSAEVQYETVTRIDGSVLSSAPYKTVTLGWSEITNKIPAITIALEQFKAAARASMTNTM